MQIKMKAHSQHITTLGTGESAVTFKRIDLHRADCPTREQDVPDANLSLRINDAKLFGAIEEGEEYLLTLTHCPKPPPPAPAKEKAAKAQAPA